jgi:predicted metal-dependent HD superfamily phosphohydrolase
MTHPTPLSAIDLVPGFVAALGPTGTGPEALGAELAGRLLHRWSEPHRRYHAVPHLTATLEAARALLAADDVPLDPDHAADVELAVWFHDAVYTGRAGDDEEASARLAETELPRLRVRPARVAEVARLVRLTAGHRPADDDLAATTPLYRTAPARRAWEAAARANLAAELLRLADPDTPLDGDDGITPPRTATPD